MTRIDASTTESANCDLLIVGAGVVGATLACYLAQERRDLRITLLDATPTPGAFNAETFDPRVLALSPGSQNLFETIGVWQSLLSERACPYNAMHVWDAEGTASVTFTSDQLHLPALGHIVENSVIVRALHERLRILGNVKLVLGQRLVELRKPPEGSLGAQVIAELENGETLTARLLIAADGATSKVRELADFRTRAWAYGQAAIVTTVRTEQSHGFTAWQRFQSTGPLAFLPLRASASSVAANNAGEDCYSSIVWSLVTDEAERVMALGDEQFCRALEAAFEYRLGRVTWADARVCVPLHQRHATRYWQPGIVLVGDAAHSLHPLAGQGVNLGLRDARILAEEILRARQRQVSLGDFSILKRYERRRQGHNLAAMSTMEVFKRLFAAEDPAIRWVRNAGMAFVDGQAWLKKRLASLAIE